MLMKVMKLCVIPVAAYSLCLFFSYNNSHAFGYFPTPLITNAGWRLSWEHILDSSSAPRQHTETHSGGSESRGRGSVMRA